jgi:hypothetical protein
MAQPRETTSNDNVGPVAVPSPAATMAAERAYTVFDKRRLSEVLHGGKSELELCITVILDLTSEPY